MALRTLAGARRAATLAAPAALLLILGAVAPVQGQAALREPKWLPWLGCWAPYAATPADAPEVAVVERLCVFPDDGAGVHLSTISGGDVARRSTIPSAGVRHPLVREGCAGWQHGTWARDGRRLFRHSELTCEGGIQQVTSGLVAMLSASDWVEIDVTRTSAGGEPSVRIVRYREAPDTTDEVRVVIGSLAGRAIAVRSSRLAAGSMPTIDEIIEASKAVDAAVVEAWLVHRRPALDVTARQLARMSDSGVPSSVIDVVVELSHPTVAGGRLGSGKYAVARVAAPSASGPVSLGTPTQEPPAPPQQYESTQLTPTDSGLPWGPPYYSSHDHYYYYYFYGLNPYGFSPYAFYGLYPFGGIGSLYRSGLFAYPRRFYSGYPYGYPYYGYYPSSYTYPFYPSNPYLPGYPVRHQPPIPTPPFPPSSRGTVIVTPPARATTPEPGGPSSPSEPAPPHGRAINGRGYVSGGNSGTAAPPTPPPSGSSGRAAPRNVPTAPAPRSVNGPSASGGGTPSTPRTAQPRQTAAPPPAKQAKSGTTAPSSTTKSGSSSTSGSTSGSSSSSARTARPKPPAE